MIHRLAIYVHLHGLSLRPAGAVSFRAEIEIGVDPEPPERSGPVQ